jgi:two-component system sensor histidine kinase KdpD
MKPETYQMGLARADELLGLVSHELRNPLSTVLAAARRLAIPGLVAPDEVATLEELARSAARMAVVLEDMMLLAHADAALELEPVLLQHIIPEVVARHGERFPERAVALELDGRLPVALGHSGWIAQVTENLIANAEKYSPRDTVITVAAGPSGDRAWVRVQDRGPGFSAARSRELFEPFHREDSARGIAGAGLGLTVCKRLIERQNGRVWAAPRPGGGAEFGFLLPAAREVSSRS